MKTVIYLLLAGAIAFVGYRYVWPAIVAEREMVRHADFTEPYRRGHHEHIDRIIGHYAVPADRRRCPDDHPFVGRTEKEIERLLGDGRREPWEDGFRLGFPDVSPTMPPGREKTVLYIYFDGESGLSTNCDHTSR